MTPRPAPPDEPDLTSVPTNAPATGSDSSHGFGPYRFLQRLGEGGMGEVWLAEQLRPVRRQVAIKIVKPGMDSARVLARFEAERQALAVMDHPAIAKVFDGEPRPKGGRTSRWSTCGARRSRATAIVSACPYASASSSSSNFATVSSMRTRKASSTGT